MHNASSVLRLTVKEILPDCTHVYQVDDGTLFYHQLAECPPQRLYVKWMGEIIEAEIPQDEISVLAAHENAVYFCAGRKVYMVFFRPRELKCVFVRQLPEDAHLLCGGIVLQYEHGTSKAHRLWDTEGVLIDVEEGRLLGFKLFGIHRGKALYVKSSKIRPEVCKFGENVLAIMLPHYYDRISIIAREELPVVYIDNYGKLLTLDTDTLELNVMEIDVAAKNNMLVALRNGNIYAFCEGTVVNYFMCGPLAEENNEQITELFKSEFEMKFEPEKIIGSGTFGCVFQVKNKLDKGIYAVKRIAVQKGNGEAENALREVKALALFEHAGIIRYNHSWIEEPPEEWQISYDEKMLYELNCTHTFKYKKYVNLYIQMELCQSTLEDWLMKNNDRDLRIMKSWFVQIVSAVAYIHGMGKIHRDLKPSNILFDAHNRLKVCDLGIVTDHIIKTGRGSENGCQPCRTDDQGTPLYMAPEQIGWDMDYTHKIDIFTIGLIFAEMCIAMSEKEKSAWKNEVFNNYRKGLKNTIFNERVDNMELLDFIEWLTNVDDNKRPECKDILEHPLLEEYTNAIYGVVQTITPSVDSVEESDQISSTNYSQLKRRLQEEGGGNFKSEFLEKFEPQGILEFGLFGVVYKARNILDISLYAVTRRTSYERNEEYQFIEARWLTSLDHEGILSYKSCWKEKPPMKWQKSFDNILQSMFGNRQRADVYPADVVFIYCQMELCVCSLYEWLLNNNTRTLSQGKKWFKQLMSAVAYLHGKNIVHQNLKPPNISVDKNGLLKICEFTHMTEREISFEKYETLVWNSNLYMAPEQTQWMGGDFSKVDIFALGLILIEICVVMTEEEREKIFDDYRQGIKNCILDHLPELKDFIAWILNVDKSVRPTAERTLTHSFLDGSNIS